MASSDKSTTSHYKARFYARVEAISIDKSPTSHYKARICARGMWLAVTRALLVTIRLDFILG